jgi:perosamine synthetase
MINTCRYDLPFCWNNNHYMISELHNNIEKCYQNGEYYNQNLKNIDGIELFNKNDKSKPSYWIYTIKVLNGRKNAFIDYMKNKGIVTSQVHARNDTHSCLNKYKSKLKNLDNIEGKIVSIPVGWWLNEYDLEYIVKCIKDFSGELYITELKIERY